MYTYTKHNKTSLKHNGSSNHHQFNCLFSRVFRPGNKCEGNVTVAGHHWIITKPWCVRFKQRQNWIQIVFAKSPLAFRCKMFLVLVGLFELMVMHSRHSLTNSFKTKAREMINWTDTAMQCTAALLSYSTTTCLLYIPIFICLFTSISVWCSEIT